VVTFTGWWQGEEGEGEAKEEEDPVEAARDAEKGPAPVWDEVLLLLLFLLLLLLLLLLFYHSRAQS